MDEEQMYLAEKNSIDCSSLDIEVDRNIILYYFTGEIEEMPCEQLSEFTVNMCQIISGDIIEYLSEITENLMAFYTIMNSTSEENSEEIDPNHIYVTLDDCINEVVSQVCNILGGDPEVADFSDMYWEIDKHFEDCDNEFFEEDNYTE